eukprot:5223892-Pleurochrysis_carterae.AAC.1
MNTTSSITRFTNVSFDAVQTVSTLQSSRHRLVQRSLYPAYIEALTPPTVDRRLYETLRNNVMGLPDVPEIHKRELLQANEIVRRTASLLQAAHAAGAEYILEHPADRGALASPIFLNARHAPLWVMPDIVALKSDTHATLITFPQ